MSRVEENDILLNRMCKDLASLATTFRGITHNDREAHVCCLLMDISKSLAIIADALNKEEN